MSLLAGARSLLILQLPLKIQLGPHYRWETFWHQPILLITSISSMDIHRLGENNIFATGPNGPSQVANWPSRCFLSPGTIFPGIRVTYKEKKSFALSKYPIQNKWLLRLQTVCCNSLACSENSEPHESVCSLAIASLPSLFDYTLFLLQSLSCYRAPWMGIPARHAARPSSRALPFCIEHSNSWYRPQMDDFLFFNDANKASSQFWMMNLIRRAKPSLKLRYLEESRLRPPGMTKFDVPGEWSYE